MAKYVNLDDSEVVYCGSDGDYEKYNIPYDMPTADVRENVHARWKIKAINTFSLAYGSTGYEPVYECSVCGAVEESYLRLDEPIMPEDADFPNYCPNCGAQMDEKEEEDDEH